MQYNSNDSADYSIVMNLWQPTDTTLDRSFPQHILLSSAPKHLHVLVTVHQIHEIYSDSTN